MRTRARNRFERCIQILRWLNEEFDIYEQGALRVEWVDRVQPCKRTGRDEVYGMVTERGGKLIMLLSERNNRTAAQAIDTMIHEAAHVALWDTGRGLLHGDEFWRVYGRMQDAYDHHGWQDSKSYYVD